MIRAPSYFQTFSSIFQARVDRKSNNITLTWEASCSVIDDPIGYMVTYKDTVSGRSSYVSITKTVSTALTHLFNTAKYGTDYEFSVHVDLPDARTSNTVRVKTLPLPIPEGLYSYPNMNTSVHEIAWRPPQKMPMYLKKEMEKKKITYR